MELGSKLKKRRAEKNLSIKDVASRLGISESTYRDWENGRKIQGEPYLAISKVLDISLGTLLGVEQTTATSLLKEIEILEVQVKIIRDHALSLI